MFSCHQRQLWDICSLYFHPKRLQLEMFHTVLLIYLFFSVSYSQHFSGKKLAFSVKFNSCPKLQQCNSNLDGITSSG